MIRRPLSDTCERGAKMIEAIEQFTVVDLVVAAQAGDRSAMDQLFVQFERQVQAIAVRRLGNWEEARELSQDVFIQAFRRLDQLLEPAAFGGWLRQITHRMAINRLMRKRVPISVEPETLDANSSDDESPLQGILRSEQREQVREGLARLGSLDRETLVAFYMDGQSLIEMSDAFDAPIGTIKRRLHVARKRLAKEVETLQAV
jgi:RNA polymerase sigma-70 factor, ECF subfamily